MPKNTALASPSTGRSLRERADAVAATLTPQEQGVIDYHRGNLKLGATHNGAPMTALTVGPKVHTGPHAGKFASVPSFVPGVNDSKPMSEDQALDYWQKEIDAGKWPIYNSGEALNERSADIHTIMEVDTEGYVPPSAANVTPSFEISQDALDQSSDGELIQMFNQQQKFNRAAIEEANIEEYIEAQMKRWSAQRSGRPGAWRVYRNADGSYYISTAEQKARREFRSQREDWVNSYREEAHEIGTSLSEAEIAEAQFGGRFDRDRDTGLITEFNDPRLRFDAMRSHEKFVEIADKITAKYPGSEIVRLEDPVNGTAIALRLPGEETFMLFDSDRVATFSDWAEAGGYIANLEVGTAVAATLATKNLSFLTRVPTMSLAGGAGAALDESLEHFRGYQSDPIDDIFASNVVPAMVAGALGEVVTAPANVAAKKLRKPWRKSLTDEEKRGKAQFSPTPGGIEFSIDNSDVLGPFPGAFEPTSGAMERMAISIDRVARLKQAKQAADAINDLESFKTHIDANASGLTDSDVNALAEAAIAEFKSAVVGAKELSREAGGRGLGRGYVAFKKIYSTHITRKYARADAEAVGAKFSSIGAKDKADEVLEGTVAAGTKTVTTPASVVVMPGARGRVTLRTPATSTTVPADIQLQDLTPEFRKQLDKLRAMPDIVMDGKDPAAEQMRQLRTNFFELKTPKPGERYTPENRLAEQIWEELTKSMENPTAGGLNYRVRLKAANLANSRYERIIEVGEIARIGKEYNPGRLMEMVRVGNAFPLRTLKRVMADEHWQEFNQAWKTQLLRSGKNIRKTLEEFDTDPEALEVMLTPSEVINFKEIGDNIARIEEVVNKVKTSVLGRSNNPKEILNTGNIDTIEELIAAGGGKNSKTGKSLRWSVIDSIIDSAHKLYEGKTNMNARAAIAKIDSLKKSGVLEAVMLPEEVRGLENRALMYSLFAKLPDAGASIKAAELGSKIGSALNPVKLLGFTKANPIPIFSALGKTLEGMSDKLQQRFVGALLMNETAQKIIESRSISDIDITALRLIANITAQTAAQVINDLPRAEQHSLPH